MEFARVTYIMVVLILDLLPDSLGHPDTKEEGDPQPSTGECEPLIISACTDLSYSHTVMPNMLGHSNQHEAEESIRQFSPLVKLECSPELKSFLCSVYAPECVNGTAKSVCRTTCEAAQLDCKKILEKFGFSWPSFLDCEHFTTDSCAKDLTASDIQQKLVQTGHTVGNQDSLGHPDTELNSSDIQRKLVQTGHTVGDQAFYEGALLRRLVPFTTTVNSSDSDDRSGKLGEAKYQQLQSYVMAAKKEFENHQRAISVVNGAEKRGVSERQMKSTLAARDLRLNDLNFRLLWDRYSTAGRLSYDDFVAILARLETLKERFKSHRMTNLPCDCMMASFSLDDFIRDTLL